MGVRNTLKSLPLAAAALIAFVGGSGFKTHDTAHLSVTQLRYAAPGAYGGEASMTHRCLTEAPLGHCFELRQSASLTRIDVRYVGILAKVPAPPARAQR